ncbi:MAG: hypothetical protein ABW186_17680, partial [Rhodanobacteraceae bacterium]
MFARKSPPAKRSLARRLVRLFAFAIGAWIVGSVLAVALLRFVHPVTSAFMVERWLGATLSREKDFSLHYRWTSWDKVSKQL